MKNASPVYGCLAALAMLLTASMAHAGRIDYSTAQRGGTSMMDRGFNAAVPDWQLFVDTTGMNFGRVSELMLTEPGRGAGTSVPLGQLLRMPTANGGQSWVIYDRLAYVPTVNAYFLLPRLGPVASDRQIGRGSPRPLNRFGPSAVRGGSRAAGGGPAPFVIPEPATLGIFGPAVLLLLGRRRG
ncbi:MAG: hypothetical protein JJU36_01485 [Phycisphaeraceae bacterium]|nr:hypothetical protein [Phycisphaeraceae bacterium]